MSGFLSASIIHAGGSSTFFLSLRQNWLRLRITRLANCSQLHPELPLGQQGSGNELAYNRLSSCTGASADWCHTAKVISCFWFFFLLLGLEGEISRNVRAINFPRKPFGRLGPVALSPLTADQPCICLSLLSGIWSTFPRWWLGGLLMNPTHFSDLSEPGLSFRKRLSCPAPKTDESS